MADKRYQSELEGSDRIAPPPPASGDPGRLPATARVSRGTTNIVFRVESAEAARELAGHFGPRDGNGVAADADTAVDRAAGSSGHALPSDLRARFESSLGADLSGVRVHTGDDSATAAGAVGAKAYAVGQDIHFGAGHYDPTSASGQFLIAHEVAHTVQQAGSAPVRQNKLEVSTPSDATEVEADRAASAMVAGGSFALSGGGASGVAAKLSREVDGGVQLSTGGVSVDWTIDGDKELGYVTIGGAKVKVAAKPTTKKEVETRKADSFEGPDPTAKGGGAKATGTDAHDKKEEGGANKSGAKWDGAKVEAEVKKKWGSVAFTDAMAEVGTSGGSISVTAGGEWKNFVASVQFALLEVDNTGKIKFLEATPSGTVRGVVTVDGVNFECTATLSFEVKPNYKKIGVELLKRGAIKSLEGFGELVKDIGAIPFMFIEAGYETLKAAYKNIAAGKDMAKFIDQANLGALKVADSFVNGVLGGGDGLGATSGRKWFNAAYRVAKADHPDMTEEEFRQALLKSPSWRETAKAAIAQQVKGVLFRAFIENKKEDIHAKDMKHVQEALFHDDPPPDPSKGLGVPVPELEDKRGKLDNRSEQQAGDDEAKIPVSVRAEARKLAAAGVETATILSGGNEYAFTYSYPTVKISGDGKFEMFDYYPSRD